MLPVQPVRLGGGDEELAAVGAGPRVGHAHHPRPRVGQREILVRKLGPVDGAAPRAVVIREVATLKGRDFYSTT